MGKFLSQVSQTKPCMHHTRHLTSLTAQMC